MKDSANALIESFLDEEDAHEHENLSYTVRTTPDKGEEDEEDLTAEEIADLQAKELKLEGGNAKRNALNEVYERFVELGLIDSEEKFDANIEDVKVRDVSILNLTYFKAAITTDFENKMIENYEEVLRDETKLNAEDDKEALWSAYLQLKAAQQDEYNGNVSGMETALGAVSDSSFVAYVEGTGYAYVSHLLVKYNDAANKVLEDALVGNYTAQDVLDAVDLAVQSIEATDQRSSWVQSGYGVLENGKVKFKDDYVYDNEFELAYFDGSIERIYAHSEENDDGQNVLSFNYYGVKGKKKTYTEFLELTARVLGVNSVAYGSASSIYDGVADDVDKKAMFETVDNRFEDLKFAYSEDEGNFNNYFGYLYSPETSKTQYVSAFAKAAEDVSKKGVGGYMVFGSKEYGLHVVLCTKMVDELIYKNDDAGKKAFITDLLVKDTVAYNYLEATNALLESNYISKLADKFVQDGLNKEGCVVRFEKTYRDLVTEE